MLVNPGSSQSVHPGSDLSHSNRDDMNRLESLWRNLQPGSAVEHQGQDCGGLLREVTSIQWEVAEMFKEKDAQARVMEEGLVDALEEVKKLQEQLRTVQEDMSTQSTNHQKELQQHHEDLCIAEHRHTAAVQELKRSHLEHMEKLEKDKECLINRVQYYEAELLVVASKAQADAGQMSHLRDLLSSMEEEMEELRSRRQSAEARAAKASSDLSKMRFAMEETEGQLASLREDIRMIVEQQQVFRGLVEEKDKTIGILEGNLLSLRQDLECKHEALESSRSLVEGLTSQLTSNQALEDQLRQEVHSQAEACHQHATLVRKLQIELAAGQQETGSLQALHESVQQELDTSRVATARWRKELVAVKKQLESALRT